MNRELLIKLKNKYDGIKEILKNENFKSNWLPRKEAENLARIFKNNKINYNNDIRKVANIFSKNNEYFIFDKWVTLKDFKPFGEYTHIRIINITDLLSSEVKM